MSNKRPEPTIFPPESLDSSPLRQVTHSNSLVHAAGNNEFMIRMENCIVYVIEMPRHESTSHALVSLIL